MSRQTKINARFYIFIIKSTACFFGLLLGFFIFSPKVSMQNAPPPPAPPPPANVAVVVNSRRMSKVAPTPEPPKSIVRGRVFYEDTGRAVKRASIMLASKDSNGREASGLTDGNGNFQIKNVQAGTYYAFVNAPGVVSPLAYLDISKPRMDGFGDAIEGFPPIITNGVNDIDVQIPARRGGAIGGRVMYSDGDPAIGVKVEILRKLNGKYVPIIPNFSTIFAMMGGGGGGFQTDDRGVYRFSGLPAGEYIVKVTENATHSDTESSSYNPYRGSPFGDSSLLTMFYPDVFDTEKAQIVNLALGQEQTEINIAIPARDLFQIEGKVVAAKDKSPVKNAKINLKRTGDNTISVFDEFDRHQQSARSNERGIWNFKELPKGTYTVTVEPPDVYSSEDGDYMGNTSMSNMTGAQRNTEPKPPRFAKKIQQIVVEDKNLSEITIELGYGAIISGTVTTENSAEMPRNLSVTAINENEEISSSDSIYNGTEPILDGETPKPQKTNHDFNLESVAEGKTEFFVYLDGGDFYVKSATLNGTDLLVKPLEIKEGENLKNVQIVLSKGVGTLKGKVVDDKKEPVKNSGFSLVPIDAAKRKNSTFFRAGRTNENGEFELKAAPGEYAIVFYRKDYMAKKGEELDRWLDEAVKDATKVTIKTNETEKVTVTFSEM